MSVALRERIGGNATDELLDLFETTKTAWTEHVLTIAEARFERRLTEEISAMRVALTGELHRSLAEIRQEFGRELASVRVDLIRWSFVFWIGQVATFAALLAYMLPQH